MLLVAATAGALLAGPGTAAAADPPYNIPIQTAPPPPTTPAADSGPSIPLVAALTLPKGQKLRVVLRRGLRLRVYAYKPIQFSVSATLAARTARRLHVSPRMPAIPHRAFEFGKPGVYQLRIRLAHRVVTRLHRVRRARLRLRTALRSAGTETSTVSPVILAR
jgi:hypothetical protein